MKRIFSIILAATLCAALLCSCTQQSKVIFDEPLNDFREIEGITAQEIAAVEAALEGREKLIWGAVLSPEAFIDDDGVEGFVALFTDYMSTLFDIEIEIVTGTAAQTRERMLAGEVDFTADLANTGANSQLFIMTTDLCERQLSIYSLPGQDELREIEKRARCAMFLLKIQTPLFTLTPWWHPKAK